MASAERRPKGARHGSPDEARGVGALACSTISIAEVERGVRRGEEDRTRAFLRSLDARGFDRAVAERAGEIVRDLRSRGITMGLADALIAATCLVHDLTLVMLNPRCPLR